MGYYDDAMKKQEASAQPARGLTAEENDVVDTQTVDANQAAGYTSEHGN